MRLVYAWVAAAILITCSSALGQGSVYYVDSKVKLKELNPQVGRGLSFSRPVLLYDPADINSYGFYIATNSVAGVDDDAIIRSAHTDTYSWVRIDTVPLASDSVKGKFRLFSAPSDPNDPVGYDKEDTDALIDALPVSLDEQADVDASAGTTNQFLIKRNVAGVTQYTPVTPRMIDAAALYGVDMTGATDSTARLQHAIDSHKTVFLPSGTVTISNTITLYTDTKLIGAGRDEVTITNSNSSVFAFVLSTSTDTPLSDVDSNFILEGVTIGSKNGLRINTTSDFAARHPIKGVAIRHVSFLGSYGSGEDADYETDDVPTIAELQAFGTGLQFVKVFDADVRNCLFQRLGIGTYLFGSDINTFENNRYNVNANHVYTTRDTSTGTWGYGNKWINSDILQNKRVRGVWIEDNRHTLIQGNYFENHNYGSSLYLYTTNDIGTKIFANRFDNTGNATPAIDINPKHSFQYSGNTWNVSTPLSTFLIGSNSWAQTAPSQIMASFRDNGPETGHPVINYPQVVTNQVDPYLFSAMNPQQVGGSGGASWPWNVSSATGRHAIQTSTGNLIVSFYPLISDRAFRVDFTARDISGAAADYAEIKYFGTSTNTLLSETIGFTDTNEVQTISRWIELPASEIADGRLQIEFLNDRAELERIRLTPVSGSESVIQGAQTFYPRAGSPAMTLSGRSAAYAFDPTAFEDVSGVLQVPRDWKAVKLRLLYANPSTTAADILWAIYWDERSVADDLTTSGSGYELLTSDAGTTADLLRVTAYTAIIDIDPSKLQFVRIARGGSDARDTLNASDAELIAVEILRYE
jgi:hypothetical protein